MNCMGERSWVYCTPRASFYVNEENILQMVLCADLPTNWAEVNAETEALLSNIGYKVSTQNNVFQAMKKQTGKPWPECLEYWASYTSSRYARKKEAWAALSDRFGGVVLTAPKVQFRTDSDFTARILLRSLPYGEQLAFVKDHQEELFAYVCEELNKKKPLLEKIGSLSFYRASCTMTRSSEVEYLFSPKLAAAI